MQTYHILQVWKYACTQFHQNTVNTASRDRRRCQTCLEAMGNLMHMPLIPFGVVLPKWSTDGICRLNTGVLPYKNGSKHRALQKRPEGSVFLAVFLRTAALQYIVAAQWPRAHVPCEQVPVRQGRSPCCCHNVLLQRPQHLCLLLHPLIALWIHSKSAGPWRKTRTTSSLIIYSRRKMQPAVAWLLLPSGVTTLLPATFVAMPLP